MQERSDARPRLVVISHGDFQGQVLPVGSGVQVIGRGGSADVRVAHPALSREHAILQWDGRTATIADAGSTNGTAVNGQMVLADQRRVLRRHDRIRLGDFELRYEDGPEDRTAEIPLTRLGNRIDGDNYGDIYQAGRDVNHAWQVHNDYHQEDEWDELIAGRGLGRLMMIVGLIVCLGGFGGWAAIILSGFSNSDPSHDPFSAQVLGLPAVPIAFGAFVVGGIIAGLGRTMSRAARQREEARVAASTPPHVRI